MRVVFMEEVEGTAGVGEVKNVADGFARNYLLPRKLAAPATEHYIGIAQGRAEKEARRQARLDEEAQAHLVPKMEGQSVTIEVRVGEQGKLFGSVTARDIAEALQEASGVEMEHRQIDLRQPIREIGSHEVTVKLTRNVHVQVTANVEPLGGMSEAEEEAEAAEEPGAEAEAAEVEAEPEAEAEAEAEPEAEAEAEAEVEAEPEAEAEAEAETEAEVEPEAKAEAEPEAEPEAKAEAEPEAEAEEEKPEPAEAEPPEEPEQESAAEREPGEGPAATADEESEPEEAEEAGEEEK